MKMGVVQGVVLVLYCIWSVQSAAIPSNDLVEDVKQNRQLIARLEHQNELLELQLAKLAEAGYGKYSTQVHFYLSDVI